jgi:hypothetical protein
MLAECESKVVIPVVAPRLPDRLHSAMLAAKYEVCLWRSRKGDGSSIDSNSATIYPPRNFFRM